MHHSNVLYVVVIIGFTKCQYSVEENGEPDVPITIEVLEGMLATSVQLMVMSSDGSATGILYSLMKYGTSYQNILYRRI